MRIMRLKISGREECSLVTDRVGAHCSPLNVSPAVAAYYQNRLFARSSHLDLPLSRFGCRRKLRQKLPSSRNGLKA